jgi:hypothetical protein
MHEYKIKHVHSWDLKATVRRGKGSWKNDDDGGFSARGSRKDLTPEILLA